MASPLIEKLKYGADLSMDDQESLADACLEVRNFNAREDIITEGDKPDNVHVVLDGFACRYKLLPDGGRQIMAGWSLATFATFTWPSSARWITASPPSPHQASVSSRNRRFGG